MAESPQHLAWGAEALWQQLQPLLPGISVEIVARAESTNSALIDRARRSGGQADAPVTTPGELERTGPTRTPFGRRADDTQACLLVAEHQTRGRGRLGRAWQSAPGASLTFSLALPYTPADWSGLSLAVGCSIADALDPTGDPPRILLKWPNDLWLADDAVEQGGRKLGGILIETVPVGQRRMCVVGVGLNVLPQSFDGLGHGYACLQEIVPAIDAPRALARVAPALVRALLRFEHERGFAGFARAYERRDLLRGRPVTTTQADAPAGVAIGVDARGALQVRLPDGRVAALVGGEVSVRTVPAGA
jgi:BirA family biotin operon repressor/biotin-[acetyl-CoA-carboxylase] ligase